MQAFSQEKFGCAEEPKNGVKTGGKQNQEVLNNVLFIRWEIEPCGHLTHSTLPLSALKCIGDTNLG